MNHLYSSPLSLLLRSFDAHRFLNLLFVVRFEIFLNFTDWLDQNTYGNTQILDTKL